MYILYTLHLLPIHVTVKEKGYISYVKRNKITLSFKKKYLQVE